MKWWLALVLFGASASPRTAVAETIWERAKWGDRSEERAMRLSVESVLFGSGDERDLLRVRVGLITLSRGEIEDPRTIVLLLRMRREMGLSTAASGERLLRRALKGDLSLTERAWAYLELSHTLLARGKLLEAQEALDQGLLHAWQTPVRVESLVLRGVVGIRLGRSERALADFQELRQLAAPRRLLVQAETGIAFVHALHGDAPRVATSARRAFVTEATRASVSRLDPFWDLPLTSAEEKSAHALLEYGRALVLSPEEEPEARSAALSRACRLVEPPDVEGEGPSVRSRSQGSKWGSEILGTLAALWKDECLGVEDSAPRDDEDDL